MTLNGRGGMTEHTPHRVVIGTVKMKPKLLPGLTSQFVYL